MSGWDNVDMTSGLPVTETFIGIGPGQQTTAQIFVNQRHQVEVNLMINFRLKDPSQPGPTNEEIAAAVTWVNAISEAPMTSAITADQNEYCVFYGSAVAQAGGDARDFQSTVPFYFMAASETTPNVSEQVGYILRASNTDGEIFFNSTLDVDGSGTSTAIIGFAYIPPKRYGMPGDPKNTNMGYTRDQIDVPTQWTSSYVDGYDEGNLWKVYIDDTGFYIKDSKTDFQFQNDDNLAYIYHENAKNHWDTYYNSFYVPYNPHPPNPYNFDMYYRVNRTLGSGSAVFQPHPQNISFFTFRVDLKLAPDGTQIDHYEPDIRFIAHDQFGNEIAITINCDPAPAIQAVS